MCLLIYVFSYCETDPRLTDYDTLLENIHDLKAGKPIQVPVYDFKTSSRTGYRLSISSFNRLHGFPIIMEWPFYSTGPALFK